MLIFLFVYFNVDEFMLYGIRFQDCRQLLLFLPSFIGMIEKRSIGHASLFLFLRGLLVLAVLCAHRGGHGHGFRG